MTIESLKDNLLGQYHDQPSDWSSENKGELPSYLMELTSLRGDLVDAFIQSGVAGKSGDPGFDDVVNATTTAVDQAIINTLKTVSGNLTDMINRNENTGLKFKYDYALMYFDEVSSL